MTWLEEQAALLKFIGSSLKKKTECMVIGGSAMMFYGIKKTTKDIDMVFSSEKERKDAALALENAGFYKKYFKDKDIFLLERNGMKIDMFLKKIFKFFLSNSMMERKKEVHEFGNLTAMIASPEDIVLLKCATDREGDRIDAKNIIEKSDINWGIILEEIKWQNRNSGKALSMFLYDFLLDVKSLKTDIPDKIMKELRAINKEEIEKLRKS